MQRKFLHPFAVVALAALLGTAPAHAQQTNLARSYLVVPKAGMAAQFEAAIAAHTQWRIDNGDPWSWGVSVHETGEHVGAYSIRSGGHSWADFDAYDASFGAQGLVHWQATVAPLVESITSTISAVDQANSKPAPAGWQTAFVTVTQFQLRPNQNQQFQQLITQAIAIVKDKLPGYWV